MMNQILITLAKYLYMSQDIFCDTERIITDLWYVQLKEMMCCFSNTKALKTKLRHQYQTLEYFL